MLIHSPSFNLDNLCKNINNNVDLSGFTHVDFDQLGKIDMKKVEESIYAMMETFKKTPIKISNSLPQSLYDRVEKRWQYSLTTERNIRETTLARVILDLDKSEMTKAINKYKGRFSPKYRVLIFYRTKLERLFSNAHMYGR